MNRRARAGAAALLCVVSLGCGAAHPGDTFRAGDIEVSRVVIPAPPPDAPAALYLVVRNRGREADALTGVATDAAARAELHREVHGGGMIRMQATDVVKIPPDSTIALRPGGDHGMLTGLRRRLAPGDTVGVELRFRRAGPLPVRARVIRYEELDAETGGD